MDRFYTNCSLLGNFILYRGVENNKRIYEKVFFKPTLFLPTDKITKFHTLQGQCVDKIQFASIQEAKNFVQEYRHIPTFRYYGNTRYQYVYLGSQFPDTVEFNMDKIIIAIIDIEVSAKNGFATPDNPTEEITAITVKAHNTCFTFGCGEFIATRPDVKYYKCENEANLLKTFLSFWEKLSPDIISGWNCSFYDIPYLVNRIERVLSGQDTKRLSPWKFIMSRMVMYKGREHLTFDLVGITTLDYMELYRKFCKKQESEKLNYIAYVELGEKKVDYSEYYSLHDLYVDNYQKFIEYNIKDVELIDKLEKQLKLIEMCATIAYDAKVNYADVFYQVRMWDAIVYNHLRKKNIVVPRIADNIKKTQYAGAYVKDVTAGLYKWVVSFDLNSLYPNLIAQFNISPECLQRNEYKHVSVKQLLEKDIDLSDLKEKNLCITANGNCFRKDKIGFLPEILMRMYEERQMYKSKLLEYKHELERVNEEISRRGAI